MAHDKAPQDPVIYTHKDFGQSYFATNLPNSYERMWMVARAINFDIDGYNRSYNSADRAQKKRYSKNFLRLVDSPINYVYWHTLKYWQNGTFRFLPMFWLLSFGTAWWVSGGNNYRGSIHTAIENVARGHQQWEHPTEHFTYNKNLTLLFHEHEFMMDKGLVSQKAAPPYPKFVRLNFYARDQNLRKYFAHRERREVNPFTGKPN
jgi:hypothetical protein